MGGKIESMRESGKEGKEGPGDRERKRGEEGRHKSKIKELIGNANVTLK